MGEHGRPEEKERASGSGNLVREVQDLNMKKIRARVAGRVNSDSFAFLHDVACKEKRKDRSL
ncbi:MAG: hypothetical protein ABSE25_13130 [Syntrophorhabdales bacterium]|jgi:hypothetical protein